MTPVDGAVTLAPPGRVAAPSRPGPGRRVWACTECGSRWGAWLSCCPRCKSLLIEENAMPKITRHGGPSDTTVSDVEPLPDSVLVDAETGDERTDSEREADDNAQAAPDELDAERPAVNASKAEWVAYAVTRGEDRADAASWTKAELIDLYGPNGSPAG